METLTREAYVTLHQAILQDLRNTTSSPVSEAGATHSASPGGQMTDPHGQDPAPASLSAPRASAKALPTSAISGPICAASSRSVSLQQSLESRLRARMAGHGSPEYALTWKHWDMPSGQPIFALRASGRHTSDSGFTGWPTPNAIPETRGGLQTSPEKAMERRQQGHTLNLDDAATLAGWPTPMAGSPATETYNEAGNTDSSRKTVALVTGWNTPRATDGSSGGPHQANGALSADAGLTASLSSAQTGSPAESRPTKRASLNPRFSLWLMGFPTAWAHCAEQVMPSSRKPRRSSSALT